jgi:hypothetical protein
MKRVKENIVLVPERTAQRRYLIPDMDEGSGVLECG